MIYYISYCYFEGISSFELMKVLIAVDSYEYNITRPVLGPEHKPHVEERHLRPQELKSIKVMKGGVLLEF